MIRVGFIGIGRMGSAIAGRVLAGGHDVVVYNRTREKTAELASAGAQVAPSIAAACERARRGDDDAGRRRRVERGGARPPAACATRSRAGAIHVVMGTHGVATVRALAAAHAQAGQVLVAAPVLGRPDVAAAGKLGIVDRRPARRRSTSAQPLLQA